jgi:hypothetical protein
VSNAFQGHNRSKQHRTGGLLCFCDDVQHIVHAVDKVNVGHTGRAEHHLIAGCSTAGGVTGAVSGAKVCFCLSNDGTQTLSVNNTHQFLAQQLPGNGQGIAAVEAFFEYFHFSI